MEILIRYLHFLSIFFLSFALVYQVSFLRRELSRGVVVQLQRLDIVYGISAIFVLGTGLLQWFLYGKGADFYSKNPVFHTKFTLFLVIGLLSIVPSIYFGKQRKGEVTDTLQIPVSVRWMVRVEVILLLAMPLLATLMARGIGLRLD